MEWLRSSRSFARAPTGRVPTLKEQMTERQKMELELQSKLQVGKKTTLVGRFGVVFFFTAAAVWGCGTSRVIGRRQTETSVGAGFRKISFCMVGSKGVAVIVSTHRGRRQLFVSFFFVSR